MEESKVLIPMSENTTALQEENIKEKREEKMSLIPFVAPAGLDGVSTVSLERASIITVEHDTEKATSVEKELVEIEVMEHVMEDDPLLDNNEEEKEEKVIDLFSLRIYLILMTVLLVLCFLLLSCMVFLLVALL